MIRLFLIIFCVLSCSHPDVWTKLRNKNFEIVEKGDYHGTLIYMPQPEKYEKLVKRYKQEIDNNIDLLPVITKQVFPVKEELIYQYKFTWLDDKNKFLVLRYFAHIFNNPIYAGYQILFVFDTKNHRLLKILVSEVPLE